MGSAHGLPMFPTLTAVTRADSAVRVWVLRSARAAGTICRPAAAGDGRGTERRTEDSRALTASAVPVRVRRSGAVILDGANVRGWGETLAMSHQGGDFTWSRQPAERDRKPLICRDRCEGTD